MLQWPKTKPSLVGPTGRGRLVLKTPPVELTEVDEDEDEDEMMVKSRLGRTH